MPLLWRQRLRFKVGLPFCLSAVIVQASRCFRLFLLFKTYDYVRKQKLIRKQVVIVIEGFAYICSYRLRSFAPHPSENGGFRRCWLVSGGECACIGRGESIGGPPPCQSRPDLVYVVDSTGLLNSRLPLSTNLLPFKICTLAINAVAAP